jgi:hypothetical protein
VNELSKMDRLDTFNINIVGYWREIHKAGLPTHSGIFFVYENKYNEGLGTVTLVRILYVGEADNVRTRITGHELQDKWKECINSGNEICYSTGSVPPGVRTRIKAAFIFKLQPELNSNFKDEFPYPQTTIIAAGKTNLLETTFTVEGTENNSK